MTPQQKKDNGGKPLGQKTFAKGFKSTEDANLVSDNEDNIPRRSSLDHGRSHS